MSIYQCLEDLRALCAYAYEQGFHELGYDPVKAVVGEIERLRTDRAATCHFPGYCKCCGTEGARG